MRPKYRKFINKLALLSSIIAFIPAFSHAAAVDPTGFDVAGVRLGMHPAEVRLVIAKHFGVASSAVRSGSLPNGFDHGSYISFLSYEAHGEALTVHFNPQSRTSKASEAAYQIIYEIPGTPENENALKAAAKKKYGPETSRQIDGTLCWSTQPSESDCSFTHPSNLTVGVGLSSGPHMTSAQVNLIDYTRVDIYHSLLTSAETRAPKF